MNDPICQRNAISVTLDGHRDRDIVAVPYNIEGPIRETRYQPEEPASWDLDVYVDGKLDNDWFDELTYSEQDRINREVKDSLGF